MLIVIKASMFSLIKNDDNKTYPTAPMARIRVQSKIDVAQLERSLHNVPMARPTKPCIRRYVDAFTGPDKVNNSMTVATMVFLPAAIPHLIEEITIGKEKKQLK